MQSAFRYPDGAEYTGRNRCGTERAFNFFCTKGQWNEEGLRHGFGQLIFSDQAKYSGGFEKGLFDGLGCVIYPDGSKYLNKRLFIF